MKHNIEILSVIRYDPFGLYRVGLDTVVRKVKLTIDYVPMNGVITFTKSFKMTKYTLKLGNPFVTKHKDYKAIRQQILMLCDSKTHSQMDTDVILRTGEYAPKKKNTRVINEAHNSNT